MVKKDFLKLRDVTRDELVSMIDRAQVIKSEGTQVGKMLDGRVLGLIFEKESTRTRLSFEVAMTRLGGRVIYLGQEASQLARGETYADTARVISRYLDILVLRTYLQKNLEELAAHASIPVINGLTDLYHPCQIMADLMTVVEKGGDLKKVRVVYLGDGNNMANSWIEAAMLLDLNLTISCPAGYGPLASLVKECKRYKKIRFCSDPEKAMREGNVINTDTWFSMGQRITRRKRLAFKRYQINKKLLGLASTGALVLHCLPAHRGEEITDEVLDGDQSVVFDQAENRLYVQMALLESLLVR